MERGKFTLKKLKITEIGNKGGQLGFRNTNKHHGKRSVGGGQAWALRHRKKRENGFIINFQIPIGWKKDTGAFR